MPNIAPTCAACCFWIFSEFITGQQLGICRRNPPAYEGWPMTEAQDWCGEFKVAVSSQTRE